MQSRAVMSVSHILGCGKKTAWSAWQSTTGLTDTLVALSSDHQQLSLQSQHMQTLVRFVIVMYSKGCGISRVNETRLRLFTNGKKTLEALPPPGCPSSAYPQGSIAGHHLESGNVSPHGHP